MPLPAGSLPDPPKSNLDASLSSTYSHPHISPTLVLITLYVVACLIDMNPMKLSPPWGQVLCFSYWCIYKYFLIGLSLNEYLLNKGKNSDSKVFFLCTPGRHHGEGGAETTIRFAAIVFKVCAEIYCSLKKLQLSFSCDYSHGRLLF